MSEVNGYVLDTNVFIEAKKRYYQFDICPGFWDSMVWHCSGQTWFSIDPVRDELLKGKDDLATWAKNAVPRSAFHSTQAADVIAAYGQVMQWVYGQAQFKPEAKAKFAGGADPWLIAYAMAYGHTIVTHEVLDPKVRRKVPIPNVADHFGVDCKDTFEMLRALDAKFVWHEPS